MIDTEIFPKMLSGDCLYSAIFCQQRVEQKWNMYNLILVKAEPKRLKDWSGWWDSNSLPHAPEA